MAYKPVLNSRERHNESLMCDETDTANSLDIPDCPDDAVGRISWANGIAAKMLEKVARNEGRQLTLKEQLRWVSELTGKIGLTHSKALNDERVLKLEREIGVAKGQDDDEGLEEDK